MAAMSVAIGAAPEPAKIPAGTDPVLLEMPKCWDVSGRVRSLESVVRYGAAAAEGSATFVGTRLSEPDRDVHVVGRQRIDQRAQGG